MSADLTAERPGVRKDQAKPVKRSTWRLPSLNIPHIGKTARTVGMSGVLAMSAVGAQPVAQDAAHNFLHPINKDNIHIYLQNIPKVVEIGKKLRGETDLSPDENMQTVEVISLGEDVPGVFVREAPTDTVQPQGFSLIPQFIDVPPVAVLEWGGTINNALEVDGNYHGNGQKDTSMRYDAFLGRNAHGNIVDPDTGNSITLGPNITYFVSINYTRPILAGPPAPSTP